MSGDSQFCSIWITKLWADSTKQCTSSEIVLILNYHLHFCRWEIMWQILALLILISICLTLRLPKAQTEVAESGDFGCIGEKYVLCSLRNKAEHAGWKVMRKLVLTVSSFEAPRWNEGCANYWWWKWSQIKIFHELSYGWVWQTTRK